MKNVTEYKDWLVSARPGEIFVYHIGTHLFDLQAKKRAIAVAVWRDSCEGVVYLTQKRMENGLFSYRAMKTSPRLRRVLIELEMVPVS